MRGSVTGKEGGVSCRWMGSVSEGRVCGVRGSGLSEGGVSRWMVSVAERCSQKPPAEPGCPGLLGQTRLVLRHLFVLCF